MGRGPLLATGRRRASRRPLRPPGHGPLDGVCPGRPGYTGGAFAQLLALDAPDRVLSLVLISTSAAVPLPFDLPPPTEAFAAFASTAEVDWSDTDSIVAYLVAYARVLNGEERAFDEAAARALVTRDVARARDPGALQNHDLLVQDDGRAHEPLSSIRAPTLVVHGTADPLFPIDHGEALADVIRSAWVLRLIGAGHGLDRRDSPTVASAILEHTAAAQALIRSSAG